MSMGEGFEIPETKARLSGSICSSCCLPDVELSVPFPVPCLPACCHASQQHNNVLDLRTFKSAQVLYYKSLYYKIMGSFHSNKSSTMTPTGLFYVGLDL